MHTKNRVVFDMVPDKLPAAMSSQTHPKVDPNQCSGITDVVKHDSYCMKLVKNECINFPLTYYILLDNLANVLFRRCYVQHTETRAPASTTWSLAERSLKSNDLKTIKTGDHFQLQPSSTFSADLRTFIFWHFCCEDLRFAFWLELSALMPRMTLPGAKAR